MSLGDLLETLPVCKGFGDERLDKALLTKEIDEELEDWIVFWLEALLMKTSFSFLKMLSDASGSLFVELMLGTAGYSKCY